MILKVRTQLNLYPMESGPQHSWRASQAATRSRAIPYWRLNTRNSTYVWLDRSCRENRENPPEFLWLRGSRGLWAGMRGPCYYDGIFPGRSRRGVSSLFNMINRPIPSFLFSARLQALGNRSRCRLCRRIFPKVGPPPPTPALSLSLLPTMAHRVWLR